MLDTLREIFLENIRKEADRQELSYADVADRAGLSRSGIYKIMQGQREPGFDNLERISRALGISPTRLLSTGKDVSKPTPEEAIETLSDFVAEARVALRSKAPPKATSAKLERLIALLEENPVALDLALDAVKSFQRGSDEGRRSDKKSRA